jgi:predicted metal-dependent hydrolase
MADPSAFHEGVRLFQAGQFWHAHEQWEECWRVAGGPTASFYKGIIQAAAALVHWQRGNNTGLRRNWAKARPKLAALPAGFGGVDLAALIEAMDAFVAADPPPSAAPPRLRLLAEA